MEIIVKTQTELDAAIAAHHTAYTYIYIEGGTRDARLVVREKPKNACVVARGSSSVEAWESSSVEAWGSSSVVARGSSSVEAWESSSVVARGSSSVEARGAVSVHVHSNAANVSLYGFAVGILIAKTLKVIKKARTATIVSPQMPSGTAGWLDGQGVEVEKGHVVLYKRVSLDWLTQEGTKNETHWGPGTTREHPAWDLKGTECGAGKYHACSRTYFCDEFRDRKGDRYVALRVAVKDLYAWPQASYPHKVAFRAAEVLHECDKRGRKVEAPAVAA